MGGCGKNIPSHYFPKQIHSRSAVSACESLATYRNERAANRLALEIERYATIQLEASALSNAILERVMESNCIPKSKVLRFDGAAAHPEVNWSQM
jgi:hypothetical protein